MGGGADERTDALPNEKQRPNKGARRRLSGPLLALLPAGTWLSGCTVKEGPIALSGTRGIPTTASGTIPPPHPVAVTGSNSTGTPGSGADTGAIAAKLVSDFAKGLAPLKVTFTLVRSGER